MKQLINFEGDNEVIIWKCPDFDTKNNTEVVVPFTHEALLVKDGNIVENYGNGRHTIDKKLKDKAGVISLYYINKTVSQHINFGTANPIELFDPLLKVPVRLGANGQIEIKVSNSRKFLSKLVGMNKVLSNEEIGEFFAAKLLMTIKNILAGFVVNRKLGFYELPAYLKEISDEIKESMAPVFDDYGVELVDVIVSGVIINESVKKEMEDLHIQLAKNEILKNEDNYECPNCKTMISNKDNYCRNCGIKLNGDEDE